MKKLTMCLIVLGAILSGCASSSDSYRERDGDSTRNPHVVRPEESRRY